MSFLSTFLVWASRVLDHISFSFGPYLINIKIILFQLFICKLIPFRIWSAFSHWLNIKNDEILFYISKNVFNKWCKCSILLWKAKLGILGERVYAAKFWTISIIPWLSLQKLSSLSIGVFYKGLIFIANSVGLSSCIYRAFIDFLLEQVCIWGRGIENHSGRQCIIFEDK